MRDVFRFWFVLALGVALMAGCADSSDSDDTVEWAATAAVKADQLPNELFGFRIGISNSADPNVEWLTEGERDDYKPAYSPDGSKIAFFRVRDYQDSPSIFEWKTQLCVMDADGSNVRELTSGEYGEFTPYWSRDGTNQIVFHRIIDGGHKIYITSPNADPGDEQLISDPSFWDRPWSSLRDGRILVSREYPFPFGHYLLTPNIGGDSIYEEVGYPFEDTYLHHMTISPSETKVAYVKNTNLTPVDMVIQNIHNNGVLAYADFDAANLRIENEVVFTEYDESTKDWYPSWTSNEDYIIYAHEGVIRRYDLQTGATEQISSREELEYRYPTVVGQTK